MMGQGLTTRRPLDRPPRCRALAFTMIEMLLVLAVIAILGAIVLPSMVGLFTAGADAQAYNVLAGQLAAARSLAIQQRTYAGVHAQRADPNGQHLKALADTCFTAVVWHDPNDTADPNRFTLAEGFSPQKLPGFMAFGRVDDPFFADPSGPYDPAEIAKDSFTSLTFVFDSAGQLAVGQTVNFLDDDPSHPAFYSAEKNNRGYLWNPTVAQSVAAAVMFDYGKFPALPDQRPDFLTKSGQIIAVNQYTGTPLER